MQEEGGLEGKLPWKAREEAAYAEVPQALNVVSHIERCVNTPPKAHVMLQGGRSSCNVSRFMVLVCTAEPSQTGTAETHSGTVRHENTHTTSTECIQECQHTLQVSAESTDSCRQLGESEWRHDGVGKGLPACLDTKHTWTRSATTLESD